MGRRPSVGASLGVVRPQSNEASTNAVGDVAIRNRRAAQAVIRGRVAKVHAHHLEALAAHLHNVLQRRGQVGNGPDVGFQPLSAVAFGKR